MPRIELTFRGKGKKHPPLSIAVLPRDRSGAVQIEYSQDGQIAYLGLTKAHWEELIAAVRTNLEEEKP